MQSPPETIQRARTLRKGGTKGENHLWYVLRNRDLCGFKFVRQFPAARYFLHFACREPRLVVELDGGQHGDPVADRERTAYLTYAVLRFWNNEVMSNCDGVLESILAVLDGHPSPGLRFAPADLSPVGRGKGAAA